MRDILLRPLAMSCLICLPTIAGEAYGQTNAAPEVATHTIRLRLFSAETRQDGGVAVEEDLAPISKKIKDFIRNGRVDEDEFTPLTSARLEPKLANLSHTLEYRMVLDVFKWKLEDRTSFSLLGGGGRLYQVRPGEANARPTT